LREARSAVALSNEHVTKVLDVGTLENGAPYMVMEYLDGVDLDQILGRDGRMAIADATDVVLQACEAIAEAHSVGIVHRDLKPANLFATTRADGSRLVKVLDFGISKAVHFGEGEAPANLTTSGVVMGSPIYMSPEQIRSSKGVDARSDIWSLGVILYELIAGAPPFDGETLGDMLIKIVSEDPTPLAQLRSDVPPDLAAAIHQCLAKSVDARIQSVADLASRLLPFAPRDAALSAERILRMSRKPGAGIRATPPAASSTQAKHERPEPTERPWLRSGNTGTNPTSRSWLTLGLGTAVFVVGAGGVGLGYVLRSQRSPVSTATASVAASSSSSRPRSGEAGDVPSSSRPRSGAGDMPSAPSADAVQATVASSASSPTAASASPQASSSSAPDLPSAANTPRPQAAPSAVGKTPVWTRREPRPISTTAPSATHDYDHF
jgi:serine/threonine-protein kinase